MLELMIITVKAHPNSRKQQIKQTAKDQFEVWVHQSPEDGKANKKISELLAKHFKIAKTTIVLKSGASGKIKRFEI